MITGNLTIREINKADIASVQKFLFAQLEDLFAYEGQKAITDDVWGLAKLYLESGRNRMWGVFSQEGIVFGTIAICEYNDRFTALKGRYPEKNTAEIGRCYIDQSLRRQGLGSKLLQTADRYCRDQQFSCMYLHTHYFLPGGFQFWQKNGFQITWDEGGVDQIVHMEKFLD